MKILIRGSRMTGIQKEGGEVLMKERIYYTAAEIAEMLGVSRGKAYKILREMNAKLAEEGYLTVAGKIPVEYFKEKWYGA